MNKEIQSKYEGMRVKVNAKLNSGGARMSEWDWEKVQLLKKQIMFSHYLLSV